MKLYLIGLSTFLVMSAYADQFNDIDDARIDTETYWTVEKFKNIISDNFDDVTYVHWRAEGVGDNENGDNFVSKIIREIEVINKFVIIDIYSYERTHIQQLLEIPGIYNNDKAIGPVKMAPTGSLFKAGKELRVSAPPVNEGQYAQIKADINYWLRYLRLPDF